MSDDLLAPKLIPEGEIDIFLRDRVCFCRTPYKKIFGPNRGYYALCVTHGLATATSSITRWQAEQAEQAELAGLRELR